MLKEHDQLTQKQMFRHVDENEWLFRVCDAQKFPLAGLLDNVSKAHFSKL